jgi:hypothetical protein
MYGRFTEVTSSKYGKSNDDCAQDKDKVKVKVKVKQSHYRLGKAMMVPNV